MDWLIGLVPWWAWLLVAAVAIGAVWRLLGWQGALVAAAGAVAALGYGKGWSEGLAQERIKARERELQSIKDRKDVDDEIDQLGSTDVDERLARWLRDDDAG